MSRIQLVIFDFDGTLVDTAPDLIRTANRFLRSKGHSGLAPEAIRAEIGMGLVNMLKGIFPEGFVNSREQINVETEFRALYDSEYLTSPSLFEGAMEFLEGWDGQIAIVSNKKVRYIQPILDKLGVGHHPWRAIIGGDTLPVMKPHPQPFLAAIEAAQVDPEDTIVIGDGVPDIQGALAAGCRSVAVEFGYTPVSELMGLGAWKSIGSYFDLLPLIRQIT
jgi:phosphoglycolate phosphatase